VVNSFGKPEKLIPAGYVLPEKENEVTPGPGSYE